MIDRTPAGYDGPSVAYLAGFGHTIRCSTKSEAVAEARSEWPQHLSGENRRGPVHWVEIVPADIFDAEQAELLEEVD